MHKELQRFGRVRIKEPMARHTTFRLGGPADFFVIVDEIEKLAELLRFLDSRGLQRIILGGGSNILVRDEGFRGVVVNVKCQMSNVKGDTIVCNAGCITADIARQAIKAGFTGFEWGVGVPGTIGGAVRGNAGAMGGEIKDVVSEVEAYRNGEVEKLGNEECGFGYRDSIFKRKGGVVLRAALKFRRGENRDLLKNALEFLQYRAQTQPPGYSVGCIFKNYQLPISNFQTNVKCQMSDVKCDGIPNEFIEKGRIPAGWLVEHVGMRGQKVGGAQVSDKHGNFILNSGEATAADVLSLIDEIKTRVYDKFGIVLEEEMQIV